MVNSVSALHNHYTSGYFGIADDSNKAGVTLQEVTNFSLVQIAAWPETLADVGQISAQYAGVDSAPKPTKLSHGTVATILRTEPLKWQFFSQESALEMPSLDAELGTVLDVSHSRTILRVTGDKAETLLNHFLPLDLRESVFLADTVASTTMHHLGVTLWRTDGGFIISLPRSFAVSLWEMLCESAHQYGLDIL